MKNQVIHWLIVPIVLLIAGIYLFPNINKIPFIWDTGTYAQSAERVLAGEFPHRDYDELFTGGLTFMHAAAFKFFGNSLSSIRYPLFFSSLLFVWAFYSISTRFLSPIKAAGISLFTFVWTVPLFPHASPTWYTIFFSIFGIMALIKFIESRYRIWIFAAGLCGGISILFKITCLYYIAAVLIFLLYYEQFLAKKHNDRAPNIYLIFSAAGLTGVVTTAVLLLKHQLNLTHIIYHLLPLATLCTFVGINEWTNGRGPLVIRVKQLSYLLSPFVFGLAIPVVLYICFFYFNNALYDLYYGMLIAPTNRLEMPVGINLPPLTSIIFCLPFLILYLIYLKPKTEIVTFLLLIPISIILLIMGGYEVVNQNIWGVLRYLPSLITVAGCYILFFKKIIFMEENKSMILFLFISMLALVPLIQYPFPHTIYFLYIIPILILTLIPLQSLNKSSTNLLQFVYISFFILFYIFWVRDINIGTLGIQYQKAAKWEKLNIEKGDLAVSAPTAEIYNKLIPFIVEKSTNEYLYATPDAPEIYYLTGLKNPTPILWELFDPVYRTLPIERNIQRFANFANQDVDILVDITQDNSLEKRNNNILKIIDKYKISTIVINNQPESSRPIDFRLAHRLSLKYKYWQEFGHFLVGWNTQDK